MGTYLETYVREMRVWKCDIQIISMIYLRSTKKAKDLETILSFRGSRTPPRGKDFPVWFESSIHMERGHIAAKNSKVNKKIEDTSG